MACVYAVLCDACGAFALGGGSIGQGPPDGWLRPSGYPDHRIDACSEACASVAPSAPLEDTLSRLKAFLIEKRAAS